VVLLVAVVYGIYCVVRGDGDVDEQTTPQKTSTDIKAEHQTDLAAAEEKPLPENDLPENDLPEVDLTEVDLPEDNLAGQTVQQISDPNPKVAELINEAMALINAKPARIIDARDRLNELLPMPQTSQQHKLVKEQLAKLANKWLFSRTIFPQDRLCESLQVAPGNILSTIGKQHKVPYEILMEINNIRSPESLQAGDVIKVVNGPFHARIYRSTFTMDLYLQNTFVRSFPVGLGRPGRETPTGMWRVKPGGKLISPTWTDPDTGKTYKATDPDYPLGSRWIALEGIQGQAVGRTGIAFHGTKEPDLIGTAGSRGCIRLHNGDVILVYNLLVPTFSKVEIVE
jgi:LysM repeat protein